MSLQRWIRKVFVLTLSFFLVSCSSKGQEAKHDSVLDPKKPVTLELWHYYNGQQKEAFDALVQTFNNTVGTEKGIVIEAFSQGNVSELINKVIDAADKKVGAKEIPDIFAAYADTAYEVDQRGLVASLDDYLTQEQLSGYRQEYVEEGRFDKQGNMKIFPIAKSTEILMVNQTDWDKFSQETNAQLTDLSTVEGVTRIAQQYYEWTDSRTPEKNDGKAMFGRDALANYMIIGSKQLGQEIFQVQDGTAKLNIDKPTFKMLWDNYYVPYIRGYFTSFGKFRSDDTRTGDVLCFVGSTTGAAYFPDTVNITDTESYPIEASFMEVPYFEGGEKVAVQQGAGMVVSKSDQQHEYAAVVFLTWFTETQQNIEFSIGSGYMPVKIEANQIEVIQEAMTNNPALDVNYSSLTVPVWTQQIKDYQLYTNKAFEGGNTARKVLEDSMQSWAQQDRELVKESLAQGKSLTEATAEFETNEYFEQWYTEIASLLHEAVGQ